MEGGFGFCISLQADVDRSPAQRFRDSVRSRMHTGHTSGFAPGFLQVNFVGVPKNLAFDFMLFCLKNPKPCPLLDVIQPKSTTPLFLAPGADITTDIPRYRIYRNGLVSEEVDSISELWKNSGDVEGMVGFLLGCSFSWEQELIDAGLTPRHIEEGRNVPMYRTSVHNVRAGPFGGCLVVSMRPYLPEAAARAAAITARHPAAHGAPVAIGMEQAQEMLGLDSDRLIRPDYGETVTMRAGEVPVFWACGVTPQAALEAAGSSVPLAVTHVPGHMLVSDLLASETRLPNFPHESPLSK